jgi:acetyltransferase
MENSLRPFFAPRGIVVIGASSKKTKLGFGISRNITRSGYDGNLFFINPKGGELFGKQVYQDLADISEEVDLGILVIPAKFVLESLRECKKFGIDHVVIVSGGFSEAGDEGKLLELEIKNFIEENKMRVIGPNCIGLYDSNYPLDVTFLPTEELKPGKIALISHSGAICGAILDWSQQEGFGLSRMISLGNQIDVNETDVLHSISEDENTGVVTMYLEGISDGRRFMQVAKELSLKKPIIVLKAGRSEGAKKAIESHTGALAGSNNAFKAAVRKAGVHSANSLEEMYIWAEAFSKCPLPNGNRVGVLTNAGGPGVTAVDAIGDYRLKLAQIDKKTKDILEEQLPPSASVNNPIDMLASASPNDYARSLKILLDDEGVDSVILIIPPPPMFLAEDVLREVALIIKSSSKPVMTVLMGSELISRATVLADREKIAEFRFPEQAASALSELVKRNKYLEGAKKEIKYLNSKKGPESIIVNDRNNRNSIGYLNDISTFEMLDNYGISISKINLAKTNNEALRIASNIYPVAIKIYSKNITHKSDVGGVILNINSDNELKMAFNRLKTNFEEKGNFEGVLIQAMAPKGQEIILGAVRDPDFGPMLMFGSGGTEVEGLNDVSFSVSPLIDDDIDFMFDSTWAGKKLNGYRNFEKADKEIVRETIVKLEKIMIDNPSIMEIEFNPLIVYPEGNGALVVDARIKLKD